MRVVERNVLAEERGEVRRADASHLPLGRDRGQRFGKRGEAGADGQQEEIECVSIDRPDKVRLGGVKSSEQLPEQECEAL